MTRSDSISVDWNAKATPGESRRFVYYVVDGRLVFVVCAAPVTEMIERVRQDALRAKGRDTALPPSDICPRISVDWS